VLKEKQIASSNNIYDLQISLNDQSSFWVLYGTKERLYSHQLDELSEEKSVIAKLHLEGNKFLSVQTDQSTWPYIPSYYGTIITSENDTIQKKILLAVGADEYTLGNLDSGKFLIVIRKGNSIFARSFTNDGVIVRDSLPIHTPTTGSKKTPSFAANENKMFFAWSEIRDPSPGYSIYGSVMEIATLVNVNEPSPTISPRQYALQQNFPNPFNPSTMISFTLPAEQFVVLRVFDLIGREVTTLVSKSMPAGTHRVNWDAAGLSSGIYFYQISAGSFIETKKVVLLR
jgi:hypothetical protein